MPQIFPHDIKGVCLAAGLGTRLAPLTHTYPKAALPLFGIPSLHYALQAFEVSGIGNVAVNAHAHADQVKDLVDRVPFKTKIYYSYEPVILGSGGAFPPLRDWRQQSTLLMINPDIIHHLNVNVVLQRHFADKAAVSVVCLQKDLTHKKPSAWIDTQGGVTAIGGEAQAGSQAVHGFGAFILSDLFLKEYVEIRSGYFTLAECINEAIKDRQKVQPIFYDGYWCDFGDSLQTYWQLHAEILATPRLAAQCGITSMIEKNEPDNPWLRSGSGLSFLGKQVKTGFPPQNIKNSCVTGALTLSNNSVFEDCLVFNLEKKEVVLTGEYRKKIVFADQKICDLTCSS